MKAVFLDRDGVINEIIYDDDIGIMSPLKAEDFKIISGVEEAIGDIKKLGYKIIVVSNQPDAARGRLKEEELAKMDKKMREMGVDNIYYCKHHPAITGECDCRKPKDGLLRKAAEEMGININKSCMIGDRLTDIEAGKKCKKTIFIGGWRCDICKLFDERGIRPDFIVKNLKEAVSKIKEG